MIRRRASAAATRRSLAADVKASRDRLVDLCVRLVRAKSENPPGDTRAAAKTAAAILRRAADAEVELIVSDPPIANVVARLKGSGPGRRLVFSGHLDTFPAGDLSRWTVDPFAGVRKGGRLYGRGVCDMKGGIACSLLAFLLLAERREAWRGEVVVALAGDEETMGVRGAEFLLDTVPHVTGDAMICGDAGSPRVLRFGEKGMVWLDVMAEGRPAHGAHVHLGANALERLMEALSRLMALKDVPVRAPRAIAAAIRTARAVSEPLSGTGEAKVLQSVTVNCGVVSGGSSANLVPAEARASLDIRLPAGVTVASIEARIEKALGSLAGIDYRILRRYEPNWTSPDHAIVRLLKASGREALGRTPVANMRVGASDSRLYRRRGIPSVVCGLTPHNMGGPDEYVTLKDLFAVGYMHTLTAFDFLSARKGDS
ncbi:MAG: M20/M25/M40 family metallo-hydrolase [Rhodospirillales bacterium]|nr:M20/M25/M40 family metallo-hydrolase [Rhodospirillales bacterium]